MEYVELHCHSNFTFLEGASHPEELAEAGAALGYKALGITDRDGLYGVVRFHEAAKKYGIKPIFGSEITLEDGHHLTLIATNNEGYANLSAICTAGRMAREKGSAAVSREVVQARTRGLLALSGDRQGEVSHFLQLGDIKKARAAACRWRDIFGPGHFYLELMNHHLPYQVGVIKGMMALARRLDLPLVATGDVLYHHRDRRRLQDILTCIRNHTSVQAARTLLLPNDDVRLKSPREMAELWAGCPTAIRNTHYINEMCTLSLDKMDFDLPTFPVPPPFRNPADYLEHLTFLYARDRFDQLGPRQIQQLRHELDVITEVGLAGYFLIVWDIMRFARERGILAQGRGSAANSAVCFALGITNVDPIKLDLLFERFLSEGRTEPPDIDIDIANNRREEVIQYVYERYGREHAGMVCEVISFRARSAVRDVGKALGLSLHQVDQIAKSLEGIQFSRGVHVVGRGVVGGGGVQQGPEDLQRAGDEDVGVPTPPAVKEGEVAAATAPPAQGALAPPDPKMTKFLYELCQQIEGFPRHLGIHVGGMILCGALLGERVPIENASMPGRTVVQWDKDDIGALKVPKIDLLGLGMLSLLADCLNLVRTHEDQDIDPARLPEGDPEVYDMICEADVVGVFQIESRAQMNTLPRMRPRCFYDLVVEVALIRPGPLQGEMVHPYLRRRNGEEEVTYPHPELEPILRRTLGVPLFQEQGMKVAITAGEFTPRQADELRRAMKSRRASREMEELTTLLVQRMTERGYDPEMARRVVAQIQAFSNYGFPESHAASFAFLVYVSSWLKRYHPAAFFCALLNNQPMGFYSPATIVGDARRQGIRVLPVDIHRSGWHWTLEQGRIRPGFKAVLGIGEAHWSKLEKARQERAFTSIEDVCARGGLPVALAERLAMAGAFLEWAPDRRQALWRVQGYREGPGLARVSPVEAETELPPMTALDTLLHDMLATGYSAEDHPMNHVADVLKRWGVVPGDGLKRIPPGKKVRVAGVITVRQKPPTAKGFCFLTLEDATGMINVVIAPDLYEKLRPTIRQARIVVVEGTVSRSREVINIRAEKIGPMDSHFQSQIRSRDFH